MSTEGMLKKGELSFVIFSKTGLPLDQKILIVGSMSVIGLAGF
jgi:hypothetical protein